MRGREQIAQRLTGVVGRDARGDGDVPGTRDVLGRELADQPVAAMVGACEVGGRHQDRDLVGAGAPEHVAVARQATQPVGESSKREVAGLRAEPCVELAEAVDVDDDRGDGVAGGLARAQRDLGGLQERVEGQQPRSGIVLRALGELELERAHPILGLRELSAQRVSLTSGSQQHGADIGPRSGCPLLVVDE